ncbi:MAG: hypothetical protein PVI40_04135 [Chlamydiota bacterium]|jgi:tetratricopeptide (TPR) repeat protein
MASATRNAADQFTVTVKAQEQRKNVQAYVTVYQGRTYTRKAENQSDVPALLDNIFADIANDALKRQEFELASNAAHQIKVQSQRDSKIQKIEAEKLKKKTDMEEAAEALKADFLNKIENFTIDTTFLSLEEGLLITVTFQGKPYERKAVIAPNVPWALDDILADITEEVADNEKFELAFHAANQIKHNENKRRFAFLHVIHNLGKLKRTLDYANFCDQIPDQSNRDCMRRNMIKELLSQGRIEDALQEVEKFSNQSTKNSFFKDIALMVFKNDMPTNLELAIQNALTIVGKIPDEDAKNAFLRDTALMVFEKDTPTNLDRAIQNALAIIGKFSNEADKNRLLSHIIAKLLKIEKFDEAIHVAVTIQVQKEEESNLSDIAIQLLKKGDIEKALEIINTYLSLYDDENLAFIFSDYLQSLQVHVKDLKVFSDLAERVQNQNLKLEAYKWIFRICLEQGKIEEALRIAQTPSDSEDFLQGLCYCVDNHVDRNLNTKKGRKNLLKFADALKEVNIDLYRFLVDILSPQLDYHKDISLKEKIDLLTGLKSTPLSVCFLQRQICNKLIQDGKLEEAVKAIEEIPFFDRTYRKDGLATFQRNRTINDALLKIARAYEEKNLKATRAYEKKQNLLKALEVLNKGIGYLKTENLVKMMVKNIDQLNERQFGPFTCEAVSTCLACEGLDKVAMLKMLVKELTKMSLHFGSSELLKLTIDLAYKIGKAEQEAMHPQTIDELINTNLFLIGMTLARKGSPDKITKLLQEIPDGFSKWKITQEMTSARGEMRK